jgi:hypothetical protein
MRPLVKVLRNFPNSRFNTPEGHAALRREQGVRHTSESLSSRAHCSCLSLELIHEIVAQHPDSVSEIYIRQLSVLSHQKQFPWMVITVRPKSDQRVLQFAPIEML